MLNDIYKVLSVQRNQPLIAIRYLLSHYTSTVHKNECKLSSLFCLPKVILLSDGRWIFKNDFAGGVNSNLNSTNVKTNHMRESLKLFSAISNSKVFFDATMILFLSKTDIFRVRPVADSIKLFFFVFWFSLLSLAILQSTIFFYI